MSHQTEIRPDSIEDSSEILSSGNGEAEVGAPSAPGKPGVVALSTGTDHSRRPLKLDLIDEVCRLMERMKGDPDFVRQVAAFKKTTLVLRATDTGRELTIILDGQAVQVQPCAVASCDVEIQAAEDVHWAVLSGRMDADAAFFAGRVRIRGSVVAAFRVKNTFLSLLQRHWPLLETIADGGTAEQQLGGERQE